MTNTTKIKAQAIDKRQFMDEIKVRKIGEDEDAQLDLYLQITSLINKALRKAYKAGQDSVNQP